MRISQKVIHCIKIKCTYTTIQVEVSRVVTLCNDVGGYQHFRGCCGFQPPGCYPTATLHCVTAQKTSI